MRSFAVYPSIPRFYVPKRFLYLRAISQLIALSVSQPPTMTTAPIPLPLLLNPLKYVFDYIFIRKPFEERTPHVRFPFPGPLFRMTYIYNYNTQRAQEVDLDDVYDYDFVYFTTDELRFTADYDIIRFHARHYFDMLMMYENAIYRLRGDMPLEDNDEFLAELAKLHNSLMHALNGNSKRTIMSKPSVHAPVSAYEEQIIADEESRLKTLVDLVKQGGNMKEAIREILTLNPSTEHIVSLLGGDAEQVEVVRQKIAERNSVVTEANRVSKRVFLKHEHKAAKKLIRRMNNEAVDEPKLQRPKVPKQNFPQRLNERFAELDLTGIPYDARDIYQYGLEPKDRNLTGAQYHQALRTLTYLEKKNLKFTTQGFGDNLFSLMDSVRAALNGIQNFWNLLTKRHVILPNFMMFSSRITSLIGDIVACVHLTGTPFWTFLLLKLSSWTLSITAGFSNQILDYVLKQIQRSQQFEYDPWAPVQNLKEPIVVDVQNDDDWLPIAGAKLLLNMLFNIGDPKIATNDATRISKTFGALNTVGTFVSKFGDFLKEIFNLATWNLFGVVLGIELTKEDIRVYDSLLTRMVLENSLNSDLSVEEAQRIISTHDDVSNMIIRFSLGELKHPFANQVLHAYERHKIMFETAQSIIKSQGIKVAPYMDVWSGDSAIGKTFLSQSVSLNALEIHYGKKFTDNPVWTRNPEKYWEGYHPKLTKAVLYQELYSFKDPEFNEDISRTMLGIAGTAPFSLEMAFQGKGLVFFESDIFIATTMHDDIMAAEHRVHIPMTLGRRVFQTRLELTPFGLSLFDEKARRWKPGVVVTPDMYEYTHLFTVRLAVGNAKEGKLETFNGLHQVKYSKYLAHVVSQLQINKETYDKVVALKRSNTLEQTIDLLRGEKTYKPIPLVAAMQEKSIPPLDPTGGFTPIYRPSSSEIPQLIPEPDFDINPLSVETQGFTDFVAGSWNRTKQFLGRTKRSFVNSDLNTQFLSVTESMSTEQRYAIQSLQDILSEAPESMKFFKIVDYTEDGLPYISVKLLSDLYKIEDVLGRAKYYDLFLPWSEIPSKDERVAYTTKVFSFVNWLRNGNAITDDSFDTTNHRTSLNKSFDVYTKRFTTEAYIAFGAVTAILTAAITVALVVWFQKSPTMDLKAQTEASYDHLVRRGVKKVRQIHTFKDSTIVQAQVGDNQLTDQIGTLGPSFAKVTIRTQNPGDHTSTYQSCTAFNLAGNGWVMPLHPFLHALLPGVEDTSTVLTFDTSYGSISMPFYTVALKSWEDETCELDLVTVVVNHKYMRRGADHRKKFVTDKDCEDERLFGDTFRITPSASNFLLTRCSGGNWLDAPVVATDDYGYGYKTSEGLLYPDHTEKGDCGSLRAIANSHVLRKFIGMHVAGVQSTNYSITAAMTQERIALFFTPLLKEVDNEIVQGGVQDVMASNELIQLNAKVQCDVPLSVIPLGHIPRTHQRLVSVPPTKSKQERTRLFPLLISPKIPAKLGPDPKYPWFDPMKNALIKMGQPLITIHDDDCDFVANYFIVKAVALAKRDAPRYKHFLSIEEALNTHINDRASARMRQKTSGGFGTHGFGPGKTGLMEENELSFLITKPEFTKSLQAHMNYLRNGIIPMTPSELVLKDELRDHATTPEQEQLLPRMSLETYTRLTEEGALLKEFKPRLFQSASVVQNISFARLFGPAQELFLVNRETFHHCVGIDINSTDGILLFNRHQGGITQCHDKETNDLRFVRYFSFMYYRKLMFVQLVFYEYAMQNRGLHIDEVHILQRACDTLSSAFIDLAAAFRGDILGQTHQLGSGLKSTTPKNCDHNVSEQVVLYLKYFKQVAPDRYEKYRSNLDKFFEDISLDVYGDDVIVTDHLDTPPFTVALKNAISKPLFGTTYTEGAKGRYRDVTGREVIPKMIFLSRVPVYNAELHSIVWQLPEATILSTPLYRWKNMLSDEIMYPVLCESALQEWFLYGSKIFAKYKSLYDDELVKCGAPATTTSYGDLLTNWSSHRS